MDHGEAGDYGLLAALPDDPGALKEFVRRHEAALAEIGRLAGHRSALPGDTVALRLASALTSGSWPVNGAAVGLWPGVEALVALARDGQGEQEGCDA